jgi:DNA-directed RNA polymerase subunit RPC12/RpoP
MKDEKVKCGYCNTSLEKDELIEQPDGLECPVCGCFTFC